MRRRDEKFPDNGFEAWGGYMQAKIAKLEEQYKEKTKNSENKVTDIFNGISIYVNGFTNPSADELKLLMAQHGGVYHTYQRNDDYIIASNLPDTKVKNMALTKVVKPDWITNSIASNKLLDYRDYLLYTNSRTQKQLNFKVIPKDHYKNDSNEVQSNNNINNLSSLPKPSLENLGKNITFTNLKEVQGSNINLNENKQPITDPVIKTAADPNFIVEFYNNSRLHHISQLGACFKQHINDLRETSDFQFAARKELKVNVAEKCIANGLSQIKFQGGKAIMHIDMDCFFVSVGLRKRPELRGRPIAVTHSKGGQPRSKRAGVDRNVEFNLYRQKQAKKLSSATGVPEQQIEFQSRVDNIEDENEQFGSMSEIASCSYEARDKGVKNGMFMGAALKLCPDLYTIPYDFEGYKEVAFTLYNTLAKYTLDIEAVSCDEMYVDCTDLLKELDISVQDFATVLREEIKLKTGCPCSTGFGGNRLQARLATKRAKPDGQFFLSAELVEDFMSDIQLKDLPGVGRQTAHKLATLGHKTCGSLQNLALSVVQRHLGMKTGAQLFDQCRGRDQNPLVFHTVRKSVSAEVNYGIRFDTNEQCETFLKQLSTEVQTRMQQFKVIGKNITLKLMIRAEDAPVETAKFMGHGFCDVINKSSALFSATNDANVISKEVISLYRKQKVDPKELRGIGIQVTKLESTVLVKSSKGAINKFFPNVVPKSDMNIGSRNDTQNIKSDKQKVTPKKDNILSPNKKSPILGISKSSVGKRRGRPPKHLSLKTNPAKSLINKFIQGDSSIKSVQFKNPDIKKEPVQGPLEKEPVQEPLKKETEGLLGLPWTKVRELLRAWMESEQTPLLCDINFLCDYMREMVIDKDIDKVNILINFLRRRTREINNREWTQVCDIVIEQVQNAMIAVYGNKLFIE